MEQKVTLSQIAQLANVSVGTVSKVLNRRQGVGVAGRARVMKAAIELGYLPKETKMSKQRIMVVFDTLLYSYSSLVLSGAIHAAIEANFEILVTTEDAVCASGGFKDLGEWLRREQHDVDGYILVTTALSPSTASAVLGVGFPVVLIDPINSVNGNVVKISADNLTGGYMATKHLIDLGHRRIAHITGPTLSIAAIERHNGYRKALTEAGIEYSANLLSASPFTYEGGLNAGIALLGNINPPTAVFAANDLIALGVVESARRLGISVPEQISVVGFDDTFIAAQSAPTLTSVHQPIKDMGQIAVKTVALLLSDSEKVERRIQLATTLTVRDSTAPLHAA